MKITKKSIFLKLFGFAVGSIFVMYFGYHVYNACFSSIETELVLFADDVAESLVIEDSFVIRKENVIQDNKTGVVNYLVEDGEKVAKEQKIVSFYKDDEDVMKREQFFKLENEIKKLNQLNVSVSMKDSNPTTIDKQISHELNDLLLNLNQKNYKKFLEVKERLVGFINERQLITHQIDSFADKIAELEKKKSEINFSDAQELGSVKAEVPGYFTRFIDGCENVLDYNSINVIFPDQLKEAISNVKKSEKGSSIGKIVSNQVWYVAVLVKNDALPMFKQEDNIEILIPSVYSKRIPAQVVSVNQKEVNSDAVVVLKCDYLNQDIILARSEQVQVILNKHDGLRVSKKALHEKTEKKVIVDEDTGEERTVEKALRGVYVVHAGELVFKEVIPLYSDSNYVICDPNPERENLFNGESIKIYDQVVVKGKNLYDGKVIR